MKIKKCYISSFGKIKDYAIDFNNDITVINHENGWGKSTLASFIKAIFYGLSDAKRNVDDNERIKYKPWNSTERFGGYAIIERSGNEYKIERFFGNKQSEDTVTVTDVKTGKSFNTFELGKKFFQIDEEGFLSTAYFTQKDFEIKSNASLTAKYNETCSLDDVEQFEKTLNALELKAKEYKMRGDKGLISDTKREIREISEKIEEAKLCSQTVVSLKKEVEQLKNLIDNLRKEIDEVSQKVAKAGQIEAIKLKKERFDKLKKEQFNLSQKIHSYEQKLNGNLEKAKLTKEYLECEKNLSELLVKEKELIIDVQKFDQINLASQTDNSKMPLLFGLLTGALSLTCVLAFLLNTIAGLVLMFPTIFCAFIFIFFKFLKGKGKRDLSTLSTIFNEKKDKLLSCRELIEKTETLLRDFLNCFDVDYSNYAEGLNKVENYYNNYLADRNVLLETCSELEELKKDENSFIKIHQAENIDELKIKLKKLNDEYSEKVNLLAFKNSRITVLETEEERLREYEENLSDLREKLDFYMDENDIINLTIEFLNKADENLKIKYREPLQNSLTKYISYINNSDLRAFIDVDLKVTVDEKGLARDVGYYSKGYKNLIEICKRFALIEVLFTHDKPFIILDDPFVNLDDKKLASALELITKLSKEYQIIYLICHDSRSI